MFSALNILIATVICMFFSGLIYLWIDEFMIHRRVKARERYLLESKTKIRNDDKFNDIMIEICQSAFNNLSKASKADNSNPDGWGFDQISNEIAKIVSSKNFLVKYYQCGTFVYIRQKWKESLFSVLYFNFTNIGNGYWTNKIEVKLNGYVFVYDKQNKGLSSDLVAMNGETAKYETCLDSKTFYIGSVEELNKKLVEYTRNLCMRPVNAKDFVKGMLPIEVLDNIIQTDQGIQNIIFDSINDGFIEASTNNIGVEVEFSLVDTNGNPMTYNDLCLI